MNTLLLLCVLGQQDPISMLLKGNFPKSMTIVISVPSIHNLTDDRGNQWQHADLDTLKAFVKEKNQTYPKYKLTDRGGQSWEHSNLETLRAFIIQRDKLLLEQESKFQFY